MQSLQEIYLRIMRCLNIIIISIFSILPLPKVSEKGQSRKYFPWEFSARSEKLCKMKSVINANEAPKWLAQREGKGPLQRGRSSLESSAVFVAFADLAYFPPFWQLIYVYVMYKTVDLIA